MVIQQVVSSVIWIHSLGTMKICRDMWQDEWKLWPAGGARRKVRITNAIRTLCISVLNSRPIHLDQINLLAWQLKDLYPKACIFLSILTSSETFCLFHKNHSLSWSLLTTLLSCFSRKSKASSVYLQHVWLWGNGETKRLYFKAKSGDKLIVKYLFVQKNSQNAKKIAW